MLREITQIITEVYILLTYAWTGIRVDQPFSVSSRDDHPTGLWRASWRPWPLEPDDTRSHSIQRSEELYGRR